MDDKEKQELLFAVKIIKDTCSNHEMDCRECPLYYAEDCVISSAAVRPADWVLNDEDAVWRAFSE